MKVRQIWHNGNIGLFQIYDQDLCVNAVLLDNQIKIASYDMDPIIRFLDEVLQNDTGNDLTP